MGDPLKPVPLERDVDQAITALKKGAYLLKYGRRGKPKFCPFRLSNDESLLVWYSGNDEKQLKLCNVSKIIPGQRTAIFQRYPRPDKEYQSFSLIYNDRSLDLICKDKDEAEVWFVGLKALISRGIYRKSKQETKNERFSSDTNSTSTHSRRNSPLTSPFYFNDSINKDSGASYESHSINGFGKAFSNVLLYTAPANTKSSSNSDLVGNSLPPFSSGADNSNGRGSAFDGFRVSLSSAVSSSSHGSGREDFDALGDVFIWGEGIGDGLLGGGKQRVENSLSIKVDAPLPKALESTVVLDVHNIACGRRHAVLVTKQGEVFSWGEELGGRLGHGVDADVSHPKLIDSLSCSNIELVACGEYHTCAVTLSGDLYSWGDGTHSSGLLGTGSDSSHWIPKKIGGILDGLHISSVSCGPWHTVVVSSSGQLFTFGEGTFGALGHGDRISTNIPKEVDELRGLRTVRAACGIWHTAAIVEIPEGTSVPSSSSLAKLFTWGDGDKGRLGHGDKESRLRPTCVDSLTVASFCQVACGNDITLALTTTGRVYSMGSSLYGQLGNLKANGKLPARVEGKLGDSFVEEITCGSYHVAVLTSRTEVYTWGKGTNGRLGHGDNEDRGTPTLVEALKDKQVKSVVCGSSFTAVICLHKWVSSADHSICSGCHLSFGFRRKRHNCYNCGLVFCKACSSRKSAKAALAPNINKAYRVCDECYPKLKKLIGDGMTNRITKPQNGSLHQTANEQGDKVFMDLKTRGQISRFSSSDSFKGENVGSKQNCRSVQKTNQLSPLLSDLSQWRNIHPSDPANIMPSTSRKIFSASVPGSRIGSRSTSPISRRQSPSRSTGMPYITNDGTYPEGIANGSNETSDSLNHEVNKLKSQVDDLTRKSQLLEIELERTLKQLKEATLLAGEEAAKCKAAKEVIRSLTVQLKDMADRVPERDGINSHYLSNFSNSMNLINSPPSGNTFSRVPSQIIDDHVTNGSLKNGTRGTHEEDEWVEHAEPGVYITVSSSRIGEKILKRVRFSRKKFSEEEAEKWWLDHRSMLQERYIILGGENTAGCSSTN